MTGGASGISQDICPFMLAEGKPANIRYINATGLKRRGFTETEISNIKKAYKIIFRSGAPIKDALAQLENDFPDDKNILMLREFIEESIKNRGISR